MIDRWLQGLELVGAEPQIPVVDKDEVLGRQRSYTRRDRWPPLP